MHKVAAKIKFWRIDYI